MTAPAVSIVGAIPVVHQDLGIYEGDIAVELPAHPKPELKFKGHKMPWRLWQQIYSFMKWSFDTYGGEAQLRLAYRESDGVWGAIVAPQYISRGLSSNEIMNHKDRDEVFKCLNEGFRVIGTVHHHCSASAFQSGTDSTDELAQNGLHVTMGHMGALPIDLHARVTLRKLQYPAVLADWVDVPEGMLIDKPQAVKFPQQWQSRFHERTFTHTGCADWGQQHWWNTKTNASNTQTRASTTVADMNHTLAQELFDRVEGLSTLEPALFEAWGHLLAGAQQLLDTADSTAKCNTQGSLGVLVDLDTFRLKYIDWDVVYEELTRLEETEQRNQELEKPTTALVKSDANPLAFGFDERPCRCGGLQDCEFCQGAGRFYVDAGCDKCDGVGLTRDGQVCDCVVPASVGIS